MKGGKIIAIRLFITEWQPYGWNRRTEK